MSDRRLPQGADGSEFFRELFDAHPQPMWAYDLETLTILAVNRAARDRYQDGGGDLLGSTIEEFVPLAAAGDGERRHRLGSGCAVDVEVASRTMMVGERRVALAVAREPSSEVGRAQRMLEESRKRFRQLADAMPHMVWTAEPDGTLDYVSQAFYAYVGMDRVDLPGREWVQAIHPEDVERCVAAWGRRVADGTEGAIEIRLRRGQDGSYRWHRVTVKPVRDEGGVILKWFGAAADIHDQKLTAEKLQESEQDAAEGRHAELALAATRQQTELILNSIADGVLVLDEAGRVLRHNPAAAAMLGRADQDIDGLAAHELLGGPAAAHVHAAAHEPTEPGACPIADTLRDGRTRRVEHQLFTRANDEEFPVEYVCSSLRDEWGTVAGAVVSFRDIAERQRQDAMRASETAILKLISGGASLASVLEKTVLTIEALFDKAIASVLLLDSDGSHVRHGAAPHLPEAYSRAIDGLTIGPTAGSCGTAMYRGEPVVVTDIRTDPLWADYRPLAEAHGLRACWSAPVKSAAGAVLASFALYYREPRAPTERDVALISRFTNIIAIAIERIRIVDSLRESEARFQAVSTATADVIWDWDLVNDSIWWSEDFERVFGYSRADVASGEAWLSRIHPADRERVAADVHGSIARRDRLWLCEYRFLHRGGTVLDIEDRGCLILGQDGSPVRFVGGMSDITERKCAQRELRDRMKELRCVYRVLELTSDSTRPVDDVCRDVVEILPLSLQSEDAAVARMEVGGTEHRSSHWREPRSALRVPIPGRDGSVGYVEAGYSTTADGVPPFQQEEREMIEAVAAHVGRMLDSRQMAVKLTQSERLSAIGELTGGVAHDFNNLLTIILGNSEILADELAAKPQLGELARMTQDAAERAADLTRHLLAFSRRQALVPTVTDVEARIAGMSALLRRALGEHVEIETGCEAGLWQALVDPAQLESAVLNLCINARDAMPGGGRLTIELANARLDAGTEEEPAAGDYVMVAVQDTGTGMDAAVLARVFEPFFTTKETGKGSGLGLSMVYGFAKQSKGHVKIDSEPGRGTMVRLYLPRATTEGEGARVVPRKAPDQRGLESILLVEDDDMVRGHVCAQLEALGYRVVSVKDGMAALVALRQRADFDLLFTDVIMPGGISGRQLADEARKLRSDLLVLFTSGYAEDMIVQNGRLGPGVHLLGKPYRRAELAAKVREVLATAG